MQVMPDVMTPESMVTKLDGFESMAEDAVSQEDRDVSHSPTPQTQHVTHAHSRSKSAKYMKLLLLLLSSLSRLWNHYHCMVTL